MNNIPIYFTLKTPAVYLPGYHEIDLVRQYPERLEINGMFSTAFGKQYQMVKCMFMRKVKILMFFKINTEPADEHIVLLKIRKLADIVNRYGIF